MADHRLHIVCLDSPYPADYGGAIDMMNRIQSLHRLGIKIYLHYFSYNQRGNIAVLENYCERVKVYERKTGWKGFSFSVPYIVNSRISPELISELQKDNDPILLEGLHCTGIVPRLSADRKIVVRMHNDEAIYYREMAGLTNDLFRKFYYSFESRLLNNYEQKLSPHSIYACISESDATRFKNEYGLGNSVFLPAFPGWQSISSKEGLGNYCLYHGNLSVAENEKAAEWLIKKVFSKITIRLVVAGKNPSQSLRKLTHRFVNVRLESNPTEDQMNELIENAQVNVLPLLNKNFTGIRLKLLHALYRGRHCVVNPAMVEGTGLEAACHVGRNENAFASIIMQLFHQPFTNEEIILRKKLLTNIYDNEKNAGKLVEWIYG